MSKPKSKIVSQAKSKHKKAKVSKATRYFAFAEPGKVIDLKEKSVRIKQLTPFAESGKDEFEVTLSLWEINPKGGTDRGKAFEVLQVKGKVTKAGGYKFEVTKLEQDEGNFPKPVNQKGAALWLPAKLEILGIDGEAVTGGSDLEFILPPLEYDETLEFQLGCSIGEAVSGVAQITWSDVKSVLKDELNVSRKMDDMKTDGKQIGKLKKVVLHCMCAVNVVDKLKDCFEVDENLQVLKDANVSAHFIVLRDGGITHAVEIRDKARHAKGANTSSVGIELLGFADDFRQQRENKYQEWKKTRDKELKSRAQIQAALERHQQSKSKGEKIATAGGKKVNVDTAIANCKDAIKKLDANIKKHDDRIQEYEEFTKDKDGDGLPLVYSYTKAQYEKLGKLLEVLSKRYGYEEVCSHHHISPDRKFDPGKYFKWNEITPFLPPGTLTGDEESGGGVFKVNART